MLEPLKLLAYGIFGLYAFTAAWLLLNGLVQFHLLWHYKQRKGGLPPERKLPAACRLYPSKYRCTTSSM